MTTSVVTPARKLLTSRTQVRDYRGSISYEINTMIMYLPFPIRFLKKYRNIPFWETKNQIYAHAFTFCNYFSTDGLCVDLTSSNFTTLLCTDCPYGDRADTCSKVLTNPSLCYFEERECCATCKSVNTGPEGELGNE